MLAVFKRHKNRHKIFGGMHCLQQNKVHIQRKFIIVYKMEKIYEAEVIDINEITLCNVQDFSAMI